MPVDFTPEKSPAAVPGRLSFPETPELEPRTTSTGQVAVVGKVEFEAWVENTSRVDLVAEIEDSAIEGTVLETGVGPIALGLGESISPRSDASGSIAGFKYALAEAAPPQHPILDRWQAAAQAVMLQQVTDIDQQLAEQRAKAAWKRGVGTVSATQYWGQLGAMAAEIEVGVAAPARVEDTFATTMDESGFEARRLHRERRSHSWRHAAQAARAAHRLAQRPDGADAESPERGSAAAQAHWRMAVGAVDTARYWETIAEQEQEQEAADAESDAYTALLGRHPRWGSSVIEPDGSASPRSVSSMSASAASPRGGGGGGLSVLDLHVSAAGITAENFELTDAISHAMSRWEKVATVVSAASGLSGNLSLADDGSDSGSDNSGGISPSVAAPDRECPTPRLQAIAARERHRQEGQAPPPATPVRQAGANVVDQNFAAPPGSARRQHSERMAQEASTGQYYTEIIPLLDNAAVLTL